MPRTYPDVPREGETQATLKGSSLLRGEQRLNNGCCQLSWTTTKQGTCKHRHTKWERGRGLLLPSVRVNRGAGRQIIVLILRLTANFILLSFLFYQFIADIYTCRLQQLSLKNTIKASSFEWFSWLGSILAIRVWLSLILKEWIQFGFILNGSI